MISDGFLKLGRYNEIIQKIYEYIKPFKGKNREGEIVYSNRLQFYANGALNAKILEREQQ